MTLDPNAPISQPNVPAAAAPSAPPVTPNISSPAPGPDLSGLMSPGAQAQPTLEGTQEYQGYQSATNAQAAAVKKATDIANTPTPNPNVPHARLLSMVQGLAEGLGSFGTAIATHGKEGGAPEVQQLEGERQQQTIQAQQATQAQKNAAVQAQLAIGETNRSLAQSYLNLMTVPEEMEARHVALQSAQQGLEAGKTALANTTAEFLSTYGMSPDSFNTMMNGGATGSSAALDPKAAQSLNDFASQKLSAAAKILPPDDPYLAKAQQTLADPKSTPKDIFGAVASVNRQLGLQKSVTETQDQALAGLPKNQQEAAAQLAAAQNSGDPARIAHAQAVKDSIDTTVQDERKFSAQLQAQNNAANKQAALTNNLTQKGLEDTNKLWTDPQHGFAQTAAQVNATKNIVAQAKSGSELAASLEPAMAVLGVNSFAGVHRISPTEYEAAGPQAGSLYRRLNALLDKAGSGSVPSATLSEVNGIMDALLQTKYRASLDSTRQITANAEIPPTRIFVPDPNNFGALTTLDKIPLTATPNGSQSSGPDPFAKFGGRRHAQ